MSDQRENIEPVEVDYAIKRYFQSYENSFWQWEDDMEVIGIPGSHTIVYRNYLQVILTRLSSQGIPSLGCLLLAIAATNDKGSKAINKIYNIVEPQFSINNKTIVNDAIFFAHMLADLPDEYKTGDKRILLFQTLFKDAHNLVGRTRAEKIVDFLRTVNFNTANFQIKGSKHNSLLGSDLKRFGLLARKFKSKEDIINKMIDLPEFEEEVEEEKLFPEKTADDDFIGDLLANEQTFYIGALVKHIWSGLNLPMHSSSRSEQPLGGISDITNKGDFDKLLISEYANDDITLLQRLANNEALFIQRETPPVNNDKKRVILLDISLKNWGTPRTVAYAVMIAIANHPKTDFTCESFVVGNGCCEIAFSSPSELIDSLQIVDAGLHAANGLEAFFREYSNLAGAEIMYIGESSSHIYPEMIETVQKYGSKINYWIFVDQQGSIDVHKKQKNGKKHILTISLPLNQLWRKPQPVKNKVVEYKGTETYPILFELPENYHNIFILEDGEEFRVTSCNALLRCYEWYENDAESGSGRKVKGWDLVSENLPFVKGKMRMGILYNGDYVLLMHDHTIGRLYIHNVSQDTYIECIFEHGTDNYMHQFFFHKQKFYYVGSNGCWSIDIDGKVQKDHLNSIESPKNDSQIRKQRRIDSKIVGHNILKNIDTVYINCSGNLVLNRQELKLNQNKEFKFKPVKDKTVKYNAVQESENVFKFVDGSKVKVVSSGMVILISSDWTHRPIFIPTSLNKPLGIATQREFAGNDYYYKHQQYCIWIPQSNKEKLNYYDIFIPELNKKLNTFFVDYDRFAQMGKFPLVQFTTKEKVGIMQKNGNLRGGSQHSLWRGKPVLGLKKIDEVAFYNQYIERFIDIIANMK